MVFMAMRSRDYSCVNESSFHFRIYGLMSLALFPFCLSRPPVITQYASSRGLDDAPLRNRHEDIVVTGIR
jgi:hypothetical protein